MSTYQTGLFTKHILGSGGSLSTFEQFLGMPSISAKYFGNCIMPKCESIVVTICHNEAHKALNTVQVIK